MKSLLVAVLVACAVLPARAQAPQTRPNGPLYVVAHVDVVRQGKAQAMTLLKQYAASCARESGNLRCEAIQRMEQQKLKHGFGVFLVLVATYILIRNLV